MKRQLIFTCFILLLSMAIYGQTVKELEEQRKEALRNLETTSRILNETQRNQRASTNKLNIINSSIQERARLLRNIDREIASLNREMNRLTQETRRLEQQLAVLRTEYARMVQEAHINRSVYARIMFVLSAESFDQSLRRLRYLQEYTAYRKMQVEQIEKTRKEIEIRTITLAQHKQTQEEIRTKQAAEAKKLEADQKRETQIVRDLRTRESTLRTQQQRQQRAANELNRRIEQIIAEEIRKSEERTRAAERTDSRTTTPRPPGGSAVERQTKEQALITGNFAANAGRLPWPVERGFIRGRYGVQPHPVLRHVTTNNKGIYIQTPARSNARAVFDGVVTQRFSVPGGNNGVIIQHGQFRTVYANLTDIYVKVGQQVTARQNIGRIFTNTENDNQTELYFQIWRDRSTLNPENWITKQ